MGTGAHTEGKRPYRPLSAICSELERLEYLSGERIGGPSDYELRRINELDRQLVQAPPDTPWSARWRAQRLARAIENDWDEEWLAPLARAVARDAVPFCQAPESILVVAKRL